MWISQVKAKLTRALAEAQKMKANQNAETYNELMLETAAGVAGILRFAKEHWHTWNVPDPVRLMEPIKAFYWGNKKEIKERTDEATVRLWISEFSKAVKAIQQEVSTLK